MEETLGSLLKFRRNFLSKTQKEMAELIGLSLSYYSSLETDKISRASRKILGKIAEKTGIPKMELFRACGVPLVPEKPLPVIPGSLEDNILGIADSFRLENQHRISDGIRSCLREPDSESFRKISSELKSILNPSDLQSQAWLQAIERYQEKLNRIPQSAKNVRPAKAVQTKAVEIVQLNLFV